MKDRIARIDGLDATDETIAHRPKIAVRQHDTLGLSGGSACIEYPRRVALFDRGRLGRARVREKTFVLPAAETNDALDMWKLMLTRRQRAFPRGIDEYPFRAAMRQDI